MRLNGWDWMVLGLYGLVCVAVGLAVTRRASSGRAEFFLSGRRLSWWLLGVSLVATTFSTDTPNLVTDLVRTGGVAQNWLWWAFAVTGICTVFFYAKLWRRSAALTDIAFYELRYSGKPAAFLRGFRAIYLGVFFNVMIMASVNLSATKIAGVMLGWDRQTAVLVGGAVTVIYAASSGLSGVVLTDMVQFVIAMIGAVLAAVVALRLPQVGGLSGLFHHPAVAGRLSLLPDFSDWRTAAAVFIVPLTVQWWSTWYPGAEPGGGGYVAQRMLAARNERDAMRTTLLFNVLHYAMRPWPWIIVALASLIIYPDLASIGAAFPHIDKAIVRHDLAYSAMLIYLPHGLLGLMVASLAAAYMSTISATAASSRPTRTNGTTSRLAGSSRCFSSRSHAPCRSGSSTPHRHSRSCSRSAPGLDSSSCCAGSGGGSTRGASWPAWSSRSWSPCTSRSSIARSGSRRSIRPPSSSSASRSPPSDGCS